MKPAFSVIFFTTASGAGYGLLLLLALARALDLLPSDPWLGFVGLGLALTLVTAGLLSSTFHLGHPERAWRALSQWRSSWLSREGVAAVLAYLPAGLLGLIWVFDLDAPRLLSFAAWLTVLGAIVTVFCTGMIYASLKTVPRWHSPRVPLGYLAFALASGAVWLQVILVVFDQRGDWLTPLVAGLLAVAWILKWLYWRSFDDRKAESSINSATGLGGDQRVRLLESPHSEANYLLKEMGFQIARRHAARLRRMAFNLGVGLPLIACGLLSYLLPSGNGIGAVAVALGAALSASLGLILERWLFFAEAEHKVALYYGRQAV